LILEMSGSAGATSNASAVLAAVGDSTADTTPAAVPADPARPDPSTRWQTALQPLIDDGTITQAQADKVIAALVAAGPKGGPMGGPMGGGHRGFGGPSGIIGAGLDVVAKTLDITTDEVRTALEGGQSIADLAVSKGKTAQDVIDAVVAEATTKINAQVTAGKLTQSEADKIIANLTSLATDLVNNTHLDGGGAIFGGPGMGGPGMGGRGFGGPGHHGNDGDQDGAPVDTTAPTNTVAG
jgi:hypothetical protein